MASNEVLAEYYVTGVSYALHTDDVVTPGTIINFTTKVYDPLNLVTTGASWHFTAPQSGLYQIESTIFSTVGSIGLIIYVNGINTDYLCGTPSAGKMDSGSRTILLNSGDEVNLRSDISGTFTGASLVNTISIFLIK